MKIYHWEDVNGHCTFFTDKAAAKRLYNSLAREDDPGQWTESDAVVLLEKQSYQIDKQEHIISRLCGLLSQHVSDDLSEVIGIWGQKYDETMGI